MASFQSLPYLTSSQHQEDHTLLKILLPLVFTQLLFPLIISPPLQLLLSLFRSTSLSSLELRSLHPHKPFVTYNLLLGDQFNSHEFIYHLISLKSLFLTLIPS